MLQYLKKYKGLRVMLANGEDVGKVKDLYFEDDQWVVRYLVVDTGAWLAERLILISPYSVKFVNLEENFVSVKLTRDQIERSPTADTQKPISRRFEEHYANYFGWPFYWGSAEFWPGGIYPTHLANRNDNLHGEDVSRLDYAEDSAWRERVEESHLRSYTELKNYEIHARDGEIGMVEDLVIEDDTWALRYVQVDTKRFWASHGILLSTQWIDKISWLDQQCYTRLTVATIQKAPHFDPSRALDRAYEKSLHDFYEEPTYWDEDSIRSAKENPLNR